MSLMAVKKYFTNGICATMPPRRGFGFKTRNFEVFSSGKKAPKTNFW
jgi:hypothetical protein